MKPSDFCSKSASKQNVEVKQKKEEGYKTESLIKNTYFKFHSIYQRRGV